MKRIWTGLLLILLALLATFLLPPLVFFLLCLALAEAAAVELVRLARVWAPSAPLNLLLVLVPLAATILVYALPAVAEPPQLLVVSLLLAPFLLGALMLLWNSPPRESLLAFSVIALGLPYLVVPAISLHALHALDPALVLFVVFVVAVSDSAAFYFGTAFGRHKLAPSISPKKSWEGSAAGAVGGVLTAVAWSQIVLGEVRLDVVAIGAAAVVAGQAGDLVESMIKRAAGVKDSGTLLPGHGGALDRLDALLFAAPVVYVLLLILGPERLR
jgi:phosphatidate cytidylyltransferase